MSGIPHCHQVSGKKGHIPSDFPFPNLLLLLRENRPIPGLPSRSSSQLFRPNIRPIVWRLLGLDQARKPDIGQEVLDLCELVLICRLLQITDISS